MDLSTRQFAAATTNSAAQELHSAGEMIEHCLNQLTDEQVWWRPIPSMNSIGNLILHLCGNVGQWIIAGVGGADDTRNRPKEFSECGPIPKAELLEKLKTTVAEAQAAMSHATPAELMASRRIQGFDVTGIAAIFHSVSHFRGHVQEIIHLTRSQVGDSYQFEFVPRTPEQGAP